MTAIRMSGKCSSCHEEIIKISSGMYILAHLDFVFESNA